MKKSVLFSALFSFAVPISVYALGLGEMKVESALDQPFVAEIQLIDVRTASLSNVKIGLADAHGYQIMGLEHPEMGTFFFEIKRNEQGRYSVAIHSAERMTEPFIQLVVDLTWPKGQIFKVYTILLDPPGYKLISTKAQSGLTYHRKFINYSKNQNQEISPHSGQSEHKNVRVYGPTAVNENVWQVAQRYKTKDVILPQIVLAVVGANPEAFTEGNLNGLKAGVSLKIPSEQRFLEVPADLATVEVMAHDKAWNEKTPINHVIAPPYMLGKVSGEHPPVLYSQTPPVPKFSSVVASIPSQTGTVLSPVSILPSLKKAKPVSPEQTRALKAEIGITTVAVDSLRNSNALLTEQLHLLQTQNKKLQKKLDTRDKEIQLMHHQIQILLKERIALTGQTSSSTYHDNSSSLFWPFIILLLIAGGGGGAAFYYFRKQGKADNKKSDSTPKRLNPGPEKVREDLEREAQVPPPLLHEDLSAASTEESAPTIDFENKPDEHVDEITPPTRTNEDNLPSEEGPLENLLEFESGLHQVITEQSNQNDKHSEGLTSDSEKGLDFTAPTSVDKVVPLDKEEEKNTNLSKLKNTKALDTLLALAKTYIGMEDRESAVQALNEVAEYGNKKQKEEAQRLLDEIKGKD